MGSFFVIFTSSVWVRLMFLLVLPCFDPRSSWCWNRHQTSPHWPRTQKVQEKRKRLDKELQDQAEDRISGFEDSGRFRKNGKMIPVALDPSRRRKALKLKWKSWKRPGVVIKQPLDGEPSKLKAQKKAVKKARREKASKDQAVAWHKKPSDWRLFHNRHNSSYHRKKDLKTNRIVEQLVFFAAYVKVSPEFCG